MNRYIVNAGRAVVMSAVLILGLTSTGSAKALDVKRANLTDVQGTVSATFYGCASPMDFANMVVLQPIGAAGPVEFFGPPAEASTTVMNMTADQARRAALDFLQCNPDFQEAQVSRVLGSDGAVIAYEIRPIYSVTTFGGHVFSTWYEREGNTLEANVQIDPEVLIREGGQS